MAAHPQSLSPVIPSGRGAMVAAISTFPVPIRSREQFSQEQPPCCSQKRSEKSEKVSYITSSGADYVILLPSRIQPSRTGTLQTPARPAPPA